MTHEINKPLHAYKVAILARLNEKPSWIAVWIWIYWWIFLKFYIGGIGLSILRKKLTVG